MIIAKILFNFAIVLLLWSYLLYPFFIWAVTHVCKRSYQKGLYCGSVSFIVPAYNEESVIAEKVENSLNLDWGKCKSELIFISDGSEDDTNAIIKSYQKDSDRLQFIEYQPRSGKANAINLAVKQAKGEVLIFSDSNVIINKKSTIELLKAFKDANVGAVCGKVLVKARGTNEIAGESLYMKYEGAIQASESKLYSMIGIDGAFFAMRRECFVKMPVNTIIDDFFLSMAVLRKAKRIVYEENAIAVEEVIPSSKNEFKRKARIVSGGYQYLFIFFKEDLKKLPPIILGMFISHKILRWQSPILLLLIFLTNIILSFRHEYIFVLFLQICFYTISLLGYFNESFRKDRFIYLPYFFCVINYAALSGLIRALSFKTDPLWKKVDRK